MSRANETGIRRPLRVTAIRAPDPSPPMTTVCSLDAALRNPGIGDMVKLSPVLRYAHTGYDQLAIMR
jgi:hypothetical protein